MSGSSSSQPVRSAKSIQRRASHSRRQASSASYVREDQMGDPIRSCGRKRKGRASSHGKAHNRDLVVIEGIDDACEIAGKMGARILRGIVGRIAMTVPALVVSDDGVAVG